MEHISQHLQKTINQPEQNSLSKVSNLISKLAPDEKVVVELKYKSKPFGMMDLSERTKWTKGLLTKVHVITGWVIPENELLNVLVDQFEKKLFETYPNFNPDEIEHAFRSGATAIQDWGKSVNLSLIDQVMIPYAERRFEISRFEENQKSKHAQIEYKEDLSEKAMADWWKDIEHKVRVENYKMDFVPVSLYEWMDKQGGISKTGKEKKEYLVKAQNWRLMTLITNYETNTCEDNKVLLNHFRSMQDDGCFTGVEAKKLIDLSKRMIVFDMMKS